MPAVVALNARPAILKCTPGWKSCGPDPGSDTTAGQMAMGTSKVIGRNKEIPSLHPGQTHHSPLPDPRAESPRPLPLVSRFWPAAAEAKLDVN